MVKGLMQNQYQSAEILALTFSETFDLILPLTVLWAMICLCFVCYHYCADNRCSFVVWLRYCVKTYTGHREWVRQVRVSPDGESSQNDIIDEVACNR